MPKLKNIAYSVERIAYSQTLSAKRYPLKAKIFLFLVFLCCIMSFIGCATGPYSLAPKPPGGIPGIYHRVDAGQTLWRISKAYNVELDEIVRINRIPDAASIEAGQLIFIPHRQKTEYPYSNSKYSAEDFIWPLRGRVIASFGQTFNDMINKGINIQMHKDADVIASRSGKVVFYDNNFSNLGKTLVIEHGDGFSTVYARNSEVIVKTGDYVKKGIVIARIGSTDSGKDAYLHFEIRKGHIPQNPYFYLPR